ncbi:endonuclease/exonuclease/phosphatase family protein [Martelella endophytica]|uniref:endonuclease/exonuclease/phosphatase family protein n=1 Tax=Martelella endophytica TaxID=1486262 RepID=UPI0005F111C1|nr:endonuclease/exonuclease/phosphatase family protein [Martelella endophytica]
MKPLKSPLANAVMRSIRENGKRPEEAVPLQGEGLRVATYNVHKCVGVDGKLDPDRTFEVIREIGADLIALQEADTRFGERTGLLDLKRIEQETGLIAVPAEASVRAHGWHGNVLLFRDGAIRDIRREKLPGLEPRGALLTEIALNNGSLLRVVAVHLGLLRVSRRQQADHILGLLGNRDEAASLIMGDMNEWRLGDGSALKRFEAAFGELPPPRASFPARWPVLALDRIISNRDGLVLDLAAHDSPLARVASDHLPLTALLDTAVLRGEDRAGDGEAARAPL